MGAFTFQCFLVFIVMVVIFIELVSEITIAIIATFIITSSITTFILWSDFDLN